MNNSYCSLGLMSGTSGDGVDASVIQSNGDTKYEVILDKYFKYSQNIYKEIHNLKEEINDSKDLINLSKEIKLLEKEITLFHVNVVNKINELEIKNSLLTDNLDLDYIEILIRQKFLFGKSGENTYIIKSNEN